MAVAVHGMKRDTQPMILGDVKCLGSELDLSLCKYSWGSQSCHADQHAGVLCTGTYYNQCIGHFKILASHRPPQLPVYPVLFSGPILI